MKQGQLKTSRNEYRGIILSGGVLVFLGYCLANKNNSKPPEFVTINFEDSPTFEYGYELGVEAYRNGSDKDTCFIYIDYEGDVFEGCELGYETSSLDN